MRISRQLIVLFMISFLDITQSEESSISYSLLCSSILKKHVLSTELNLGNVVTSLSRTPNSSHVFNCSSTFMRTQLIQDHLFIRVYLLRYGTIERPKERRSKFFTHKMTNDYFLYDDAQ